MKNCADKRTLFRGEYLFFFSQVSKRNELSVGWKKNRVLISFRRKNDRSGLH